MKKTILLFLLFFSIVAAAQRKQYVTHFKYNGQKVLIADSADFTRIISEPDSGEIYFNFKELYANGFEKTIGKVATVSQMPVFEGVVRSFRENGAKLSSVTYKKGKKLGSAVYFFGDGRIKKEVEHLAGKLPDIEDTPTKLLYLVDSTGIILVKDGNGHAVERTPEKDDELTEEGEYKNGIKYGTWVGNYHSGKSSFIEEYAKGNLVQGVTTVGTSRVTYKELYVAPVFKGGNERFYRFLTRSVKDPRIKTDKGMDGMVMVSFTVDKDGSITDGKIERSIAPLVDQEALRVVLSSPKWLPGLHRGVPVKVKYNIPITFHPINGKVK